MLLSPLCDIVKQNYNRFHEFLIKNPIMKPTFVMLKLSLKFSFQALQKFNRGKAGVLSFLDFVTYIPLFVEIHEGIVQNPLSLVPNTVPDLEDELPMNVI